MKVITADKNKFLRLCYINISYHHVNKDTTMTTVITTN